MCSFCMYFSSWIYRMCQYIGLVILTNPFLRKKFFIDIYLYFRFDDLCLIELIRYKSNFAKMNNFRNYPSINYHLLIIYIHRNPKHLQGSDIDQLYFQESLIGQPLGTCSQRFFQNIYREKL